MTCALDTGASLRWLATGKGSQSSNCEKENDGEDIPHKNLEAGVLEDAGTWKGDLSFIQHLRNDPVFITSNTGAWIIDLNITGISNGWWLLGIDDKYDVYDIALLPGRRISLTAKGNSFTCGLEEVNAAGKVVLTMDYDFLKKGITKS